MGNNNFLSNYGFEDVAINYWFYLFVILVFAFVILFIRYLQKKKTLPKTKDELLKEKIKALDFSGADKRLAYEFTILLKSYLKEENKEFQNILSELEHYKYHDKEKSIDIKIIKKMKRFVDDLG
jgi:hypothetical protein